MRGFVFVVMLLASLNVLAENWIEVAKTEAGTTHSVDVDTLRRTGDIAKGWVLVKYYKEENFKETPNIRFYSSKNLYTWNCAERTNTLNKSVYYSGWNSGDVVYSYDIPPNKVIATDVVPGSIGEGVLEEVCLYTAQKKK